MLVRLTVVSTVFHLLNLSGLAVVLRVWRHRYLEVPAVRPRGGRLLLDIAMLGALAAVSCVGVGWTGGIGPFGILNLATQWIFAELLLLLTAVGWHLHRAGSRAGVAFAALSLIALAGIFVDAYYVEPRALDIHEHLVPLALGRIVVAANPVARELRIAHLSDIQTPSIGDHERRAFREALAQRPDIVILTGDYIHSIPGIEDEDAARAQFRDLLNSIPWPRLGVYAVKGDVEGAAWPSMFEGTRVVTLTDNAVRIPLPNDPTRQLSLLGLSPAVARGSDTGALRRFIRALPPDDLKIVIGHSPDYVMQLDPGSVDLAMGGHTHGGQIALPFVGAPITLSRLPRRMARGLHDWKGTPLHVSAGVGMERHYAPQVRFLCRPEACLLRLPL